jgi:hypothetical protein
VAGAPRMKSIRTGFFIIRGDDGEFKESKGYFWSNGLGTGYNVVQRLTGTGRGVRWLFSDELALEERAF